MKLVISFLVFCCSFLATSQALAQGNVTVTENETTLSDNEVRKLITEAVNGGECDASTLPDSKGNMHSVMMCTGNDDNDETVLTVLVTDTETAHLDGYTLKGEIDDFYASGRKVHWTALISPI